MPWVGHELNLNSELPRLDLQCSCGWSKRYSGHTPPNVMWQGHLREVRAVFRHAPGDELYDSEDGMMTVSCGCGWGAGPVHHRNGDYLGNAWNTHLQQAQAKEWA